jgi:hypothetical protein
MLLPRFIARSLTGAALLVAAVGGCNRASSGGRIEVTYTIDEEKSKDPRAYSGPARAFWCPGAGRLEVMSVNEDMGFGLVLYPEDSLVAGNYPSFDPGIDSVRRPGAAGVARWYTEQRIVGLQSDSGMLKLVRDGAKYDATFGFRLRSLDASDTTRVTGRASGLVPGACPADSLPSTAPKQ